MTGLLSLVFLVTDDQPVVIQTEEVNPQSLSDTKRLLKQINYQLKLPGGNKQIKVPFDALNALFSLASDILNQLSARYNELGDLLLISVSIQLPNNIAGKYVNITLQLGHDYFDTETSRTAIGKLDFSNVALVNTISTIISMITDKTVLPNNEALISNVIIQNRSINIILQPQLNTAKLLSHFKKAGKDVATTIFSDHDFVDVQTYYDHLVTSTRYLDNINIPVSLYELLKIVMSLAEKRSDDSNAKNQNTSALIALALFAGDYNLKTTLNGFLNITLNSNVKINSVLSNREDLMLHFIYSSMIQILSNEGITFSIGEIKEVSDSRKGGSGFSFVDIAADKAGIKFADEATKSNSSALKLQQRITMSTREEDIFPATFALSENISADQFKVLYANRQSRDYKAIISEIDRRIDALMIYKNNSP